MLLIRNETVQLFSDPYQLQVLGNASVFNVADAFSYAAGFSQTISLTPGQMGYSVALPFLTAGAYLRIECLQPIQFALNGDSNFSTMVPPSPSAGGTPLSAVAEQMVTYSSLTLNNPTSGIVYINILAAGT